MDGYFEQPDATAEALQDGWYHTGDLGSLDDEGYLSIVGRARDVLRTGGETVAPLEVEDALRDHPAIVEIAVVGIPDPQWGEIVCAVVVAHPGREGEVDVDVLRAHCRERLAPVQAPAPCRVRRRPPPHAGDRPDPAGAHRRTDQLRAVLIVPLRHRPGTGAQQSFAAAQKFLSSALR